MFGDLESGDIDVERVQRTRQCSYTLVMLGERLGNAFGDTGAATNALIHAEEWLIGSGIKPDPLPSAAAIDAMVDVVSILLEDEGVDCGDREGVV